MTDTFRKTYNSCYKLKEFSDELKTLAEGVESKIKEIGTSREISLALTNLEQSIMWAVKALFMFGDKKE